MERNYSSILEAGNPAQNAYSTSKFLPCKYGNQTHFRDDKKLIESIIIANYLRRLESVIICMQIKRTESAQNSSGKKRELGREL